MAAIVLAALALSACGGTSTVAPGPSSAQQAAKIQRDGARPGYVPACPCWYVANEGGGPFGNGIIDIFPVSANGNFSPGANTIGGSNTGLLYPRDIAVGPTGTIYVANSNEGGTDRVTVYTAGSSGNATPIQTISGSNTGLSDILGIALDAAGDIYVSSSAQNGPGAQSVNVFAPAATGNVATLRTISGALTGISHPYQLATDPAGNLYVANSSNILVFSPGANGNVAPVRTINPGGIGVAWHHGPPAVGRIYVAGGNGVAIFRANANGNVTPLKTISGSLTDLNQAEGIAVGPGGAIFVGNIGQNANGTFDVTKYSPFGVLAPGNNNVAPVKMIVGSNTDLWLPDGVAVH
jgi:hypothetical protein